VESDKLGFWILGNYDITFLTYATRRLLHLQIESFLPINSYICKIWIVRKTSKKSYDLCSL
jgi:hypothetical protein